MLIKAFIPGQRIFVTASGKGIHRDAITGEPALGKTLEVDPDNADRYLVSTKVTSPPREACAT